MIPEPNEQSPLHSYSALEEYYYSHREVGGYTIYQSYQNNFGGFEIDGWYYPLRVSAKPLCKSEHGGKALSLEQLINCGTHVPRAYVIPCQYTFLRPKIALDIIRRHTNAAMKFAVRSGAAVSMPGLLSTKLNQTLDEVPAAIEAVWDSWDTPHAIAYREANGIPHDSGTAVIIQEMAPCDYAGVAFTADPSDPLSKDVFNPVVEYVEGFGESLVGGTQTPLMFNSQVNKDDKISALHNRLYTALRDLHSILGPSDIEWCAKLEPYGIGKWMVSLYFVQRRDIRFAKIVPNENVSLGKWITRGKPIGTPTTVKVRLKGAKEGCAAYAECFTPEMYLEMLNAPVILTKEGGETCHASIIARQLGRVAVSCISYDAYKELRQHEFVIVDGKTGDIYEPAEDARVDDALLVSTNAVRDKSRTPDFSFTEINPGYQASLLLCRFYYTLDKIHKQQITKEKGEAVIKEIADIICTYFYIACLCESRWAKTKITKERCETKTSIFRSMRRRGIEFYEYKNKHKGYDIRETFFSACLKQPKTLKSAVSAIRTCHRLFTELYWNGSFGGAKWGDIAKVVLDYLTGELTPTLFVDRCFNLKHNGGCAFGKFSWLQSGYDLDTLLDVKRNGTTEMLLKTASNSWNSVEEFCERESISGKTSKKEEETVYAGEEGTASTATSNIKYEVYATTSNEVCLA